LARKIRIDQRTGCLDLRTKSCVVRSNQLPIPLANQMRLILHTGAYWLLLDLRAAIPSWNSLRKLRLVLFD
jgi:hypothetical protein